MKPVSQSEQSFQSPTELQENGPQGQQTRKSTPWYIYIILAAVIIFSIYLLLSLVRPKPPIVQLPKDEPADFNFRVFCPQSSKNASSILLAANRTSNDDLRRRLLTIYSNTLELKKGEDPSNYNPNTTYEIHVLSDTSNKTNKPQLYYCGFTRGFYQADCSNPIYSCVQPNPMFQAQTSESIDIIWMNYLNSSVVPSYPSKNYSCMSNPENSSFCHMMAKVNRSQTYLDPTSGSIDSKVKDHKSIYISSSNWPFSTHLHGAQVRPAFDGNPLSWIDNNNQSNYGVGALSIDQDCYFNAFDSFDQNGRKYNPPKFIIRNANTGQGFNNFKTNRYPNKQNPGTLWFHDHSMHLTQYNVAFGLSGFYILRNPKVEQQIGVDRSHQKLVMISRGKVISSFNISLDGFEVGTVYRFRFLNNYFTYPVWRVSFKYGICSDRNAVQQKFSIIGADSSLFHQSIDNQVSFDMASAERMEILIIFQNYSSFSICVENPDQAQPMKFSSSQSSHYLQGIKLKPRDVSLASKNKRATINNISLSVPFTNLSQLQSQVSVRRMRILTMISRGIQGTLTINARMNFHKGRSEDPILGSVEDWFLINNVNFGHPIHIHLINYQVIRSYSLRYLSLPNNQGIIKNCSIYYLDFLIEAVRKSNNSEIQKMKPYIFPDPINNSIINYTYLCFNTGSMYMIDDFINNDLANIYPEDDSSTNIRGIDIALKRNASDNANLGGLHLIPPLNTSNFKYIQDQGTPHRKPYYQRFKDTAFVYGFQVLQLRIRWTKSDFSEEDRKAGVYFNVPADQLREYPGFVYHCHLLDHEDNQMMRPIMLRLPNNTRFNTSTTCNYSPETKKAALNWSDKYNCVNKVCGNQPT